MRKLKRLLPARSTTACRRRPLTSLGRPGSLRAGAATLLAVTLLVFGACGAGDEASAPAARVDGEVITIHELDEWIKQRLLEKETGGSEETLRELRRRELEHLVRERLMRREAERRGQNVQQMIEDEVARGAAVEDAEVRRFYEENRAQFQAGTTFDDVAPDIRNFLVRREALNRFDRRLHDAAEVEVLIDTPRSDVSALGPALGPEDAPVTIVEFSDYQCPYCQRAEAVLAELRAEYPGRLRFVYKHFPLESIHPRARPAAQAAACAGEQGRFWEYHDLLFAPGAPMEERDLQSYAALLNLDRGRFAECRQSGRGDLPVARDIAEAERLGVSSTPTFFINGIRLRGMPPIARLRLIVEDELARAANTN